MRDSLFPSGPWTGFYNYRPRDRHRMDLRLTFANGQMSGDGSDDIGRFLIRGRYDPTSRECYWTKSYLGAHDVFYRGFREGKGIWGTWEIGTWGHGGFHIWPRTSGKGEAESEAAAVEEPVDAVGCLHPATDTDKLPAVMIRESAGLLMYRVKHGELEFLLVHPGGPFWKKKDAGAWTVPKGELGPDEEPLAAAKREFEEELGFRAEGSCIPLTPVRQKGGKLVRAWAVQGDCDPAACRSNTFEMEWPPGSGRNQAFPEVDQAAFFTLAQAREKMNPAQLPLLEEVTQLHKARSSAPS